MPDKIVKFSVGEHGTVFTIHKVLLAGIPYFKGCLKKDRFREGSKGSVDMSDVDAGIFKKFVEYIYLQEYYPRIMPETRNPCYSGNGALYHEHSMKYCDRFRHGGSGSCARLETYLEVFEPKSNWPRIYDHNEKRMGHWKTSDETHALFEEQLAIFSLAEYFMLESLKRLCLEKIVQFPLGPRALAALAEHVYGNVSDIGGIHISDDSSTSLLDLTQQCFNYHEVFLNDRRPRLDFEDFTNHYEKSSPAHQYKDFEKLLAEHMSPTGRTIYEALRSAQESREFERTKVHSWWECKDEQIGVCETDYLPYHAKQDFRKFYDLDDDSPDIPELVKDDNLFEGFQFLPSQEGDWWCGLVVDMPIQGLVYGKNMRLNDWGFHRRSAMRMLETKSWKDCSCIDCSPPTHKIDGLRFSPHDPDDLGLPYRRGPRHVRHQRRPGRKSTKAPAAPSEDMNSAGPSATAGAQHSPNNNGTAAGWWPAGSDWGAEPDRPW